MDYHLIFDIFFHVIVDNSVYVYDICKQANKAIICSGYYLLLVWQ